MERVSGHPIRAVVLADDPRVCHAFAGLLVAGARGQLIVEEAEVGAEAGAIVSHDCPDVVVIDLDRPDVEPWLGVIAALRCRCATVALVAIGAGTTLPARAIDAGADAFVSKLRSPQAMCDAIDAVIRRRRPSE